MARTVITPNLGLTLPTIGAPEYGTGGTDFALLCQAIERIDAAWGSLTAGSGPSLRALAAPDGGASYTIGSSAPFSPAAPAASLYFVNGIKRIYRNYYTISGSTLTILAPTPPQTGDTHELYAS
jgi:hypothetical protein